MSKVDVYLKGGAVIRLDVKDFGVKVGESGDLYSVRWESTTRDRPLYINPAQVAAVIER